jgi:diguanylate cyclase (GGDEF)-like protein
LETVTQGKTEIRDRVYLDAYKWLVEAYRSLGLFQEALATQTNYIKLLSLEYEEINQKAIEEVSSSFRLAAARSESKNAELERGLEEEKRIRAQLTTWILIMVVIGLIVTLTFVVFILVLLRRKTKTLNEIAWVDPLTGVGNRLLMGQDAQKNLPNFVALIDIDHLKYYNDQYGHAKGDALLVYFAHKLKNQISQLPFTSYVYRIGGDEFVVTAEQGDKAVFESCIESIDHAIRKEGFSKAGLSYGIAEKSEFADFSEALSMADARMYEMKSNRKNNR